MGFDIRVQALSELHKAMTGFTPTQYAQHFIEELGDNAPTCIVYLDDKDSRPIKAIKATRTEDNRYYLSFARVPITKDNKCDASSYYPANEVAKVLDDIALDTYFANALGGHEQPHLFGPLDKDRAIRLFSAVYQLNFYVEGKRDAVTVLYDDRALPPYKKPDDPPNRGKKGPP